MSFLFVCLFFCFLKIFSAVFRAQKDPNPRKLSTVLSFQKW